MLGPIYLHSDGSFDSYRSFFAHLQSKLDSVELGGVEAGVTEMIVGSDEEKPLTKAIHRCFPESTVLLCCRHLEKNARRRLQDKVGAVLPVREKILQDLFGSDGLSNADDTHRFDKLACNIINNCETTVPDFTSYLTTKLIAALHAKVVNPRLQHGLCR